MPNKKIKDILKEKKLAPKKRFGQNFLVDSRTAARIVELAGLDRSDTVIEIGVGFGALTRHLAERCCRVIGLEIDAGIIRWLREEGGLPANVTLIHQDVLKTDLAGIAALAEDRLKIVANLPYSISNPLLFKLIDNREFVEWAVLMVQKEVGQRLTASPGTKAYGIITVMMAACAEIKTIMKLGPGHFHPRPKIDSQVLRLVFHPAPARAAALPEHDPVLLNKLVRASFQQRRKTLLNTLSAAGLPGLDRQALEQVLNNCGISPETRGERLTIEDFVSLSIALQEKMVG